MLLQRLIKLAGKRIGCNLGHFDVLCILGDFEIYGIGVFRVYGISRVFGVRVEVCGFFGIGVGVGYFGIFRVSGIYLSYEVCIVDGENYQFNFFNFGFGQATI